MSNFGIDKQLVLLLPESAQIQLQEAIVNSNTIKVSGSFLPSSTILKAAYKTVLKSECRRYKHAAVITKGNKIIYSACNIRHKTHPQGSGPYVTTHAEVRTIIGAKRIISDLNDLKIFIMRSNSRGQIKVAKPCLDCMNLIIKEGLQAAWTDEENNYINLSNQAKAKIMETYGYGLNVKKF